MNLVVATLVLASAVMSTYFFCVRPMRRGSCTTMCIIQSGSSRYSRDTDPSNLEVDLTHARQELASLSSELKSKGPFAEPIQRVNECMESQKARFSRA